MKIIDLNKPCKVTVEAINVAETIRELRNYADRLESAANDFRLQEAKIKIKKQD